MRNFLLFIGSIVLLFSCKKDETTAVQDYSHYEGSFYGEQNKTTEFGQHQSSTTSDKVVFTRIENGNLLFSNTSFDLDDPNTIHLNYDANDYSHSAYASFGNEFNDFGFPIDVDLVKY